MNMSRMTTAALAGVLIAPTVCGGGDVGHESTTRTSEDQHRMNPTQRVNRRGGHQIVGAPGVTRP